MCRLKRTRGGSGRKRSVCSRSSSGSCSSSKVRGVIATHSTPTFCLTLFSRATSCCEAVQRDTVRLQPRRHHLTPPIISPRPSRPATLQLIAHHRLQKETSSSAGASHASGASSPLVFPQSSRARLSSCNPLQFRSSVIVVCLQCGFAGYPCGRGAQSPL